MKRNLKVVKTEEYMWRSYCWNQHHGYAYVTCWWVRDADTDELILGGYNNGNNTRSGSVFIERKRDAKAFIDGYSAFHKGDAKVGCNKAGYHFFDSGEVPDYRAPKRYGNRMAAYEAIDSFKTGAVFAAEEEKGDR
jgi:hypothetical protein